MNRWLNKVAVVTGASSGIGAAITKDLVRSGVRVIGLARRTDKIEQIIANLPHNQKPLLKSIYCDVSKPESVDMAFDEITHKLGGIDILVNNAGCVKIGQMVTMDPQEMKDTIETNIMGVVYCTQHAFKSMQERKIDGHVFMINSLVGHRVIARPNGKTPISNIYAPSKHAVTAMVETYRQEFRTLGTRIKITDISPGLVDTELLDPRVRDAYKDCILKPADISNAMMYALSTAPHVQIHEIVIKPVGEIV